MSNKKPLTSAETTRRSVKKRQEAGLIYGKVWMHPDEAASIREHAANQPKTKAILEGLKNV